MGIAIAAIVLLPESLAAIRAAYANRLQTSLNLALGSALATIGLTIPAVAIVSFWLGLPLTLGLDAKGIVLLALTLFVAACPSGAGCRRSSGRPVAASAVSPISASNG